MSVLLVILYVLAVLSGTAVALTREPRRQVLAISVNGAVLALLFFGLQAPDVAFSEIVVGTAAVPLMFLVTLANARMRRQKQ